MKKRILALFLAVIMVVSLLPTVAFAMDEHYEDDYDTWTNWGDDPAEQAALPTDAGNYYLTHDVELTETWTVPAGTPDSPAVTKLCLNGFVIKQTGTGKSVITVPANATLNLYDCGVTLHDGYIDDSTHLWTVDESDEHAGQPDEYDIIGGIITGGKNSGIIVEGTLNMYGGSIAGNTTANNGGGVVVKGTFNMYGGTIENCTATGSDSPYGMGGGVYVADNPQYTLNIDGGIIQDCFAQRWGGGVANQGTMTITKGAIQRCTANGGGGVNNDCIFHMNGGTIENCKAVGVVGNDGDTKWYSGGIRVANGKPNAEVIIGGDAKIINNTRIGDIASNLYLENGKTITLGTKEGENNGNGVAAPTSDFKVGVTTKTAPTDEKNVKIVESASEGDKKYFVSDADYSIVFEDNELQLEYSYPIKVGGTPITPANEDDVLGDGKISYDPATRTLTLNNAKIAVDGSRCASAINSDLKGDLTIKLVGENQIGAKPAVATNKSNYQVAFGIAASDDNVTITGNGSLTMYTWMYGIWADNVDIFPDFAGTLTIENYGEIGYITENVYYSDTSAIRADNNVGIRGGTVNVTCHDGGGIYAGEGNIVIEGGATVNVTSDKFSAIKAAPGTIKDDEIIGSYYAGGGDVYIYNGAKVTVNAGTKAEELLTDVYGIYAAGCIKIGFEDEIYDDPAEQPPTPAPEEVSVTVGNTNLSGAYDIDGIKSENGNTSVIGSKVSVISVNGRGFNIGVCGGPECGDIIIIDSTVDVDAGTSGIVAYEDGIDCNVTITNSTVNVKAETWGINALNDVVITDSKVTVESDTWGIECDTLTVEGAQTQIKSTGGEVGLVVCGGENALMVKNGSLQLVGGEMALDVGENPEFTMSLPDGYALKGTRKKNVFTDLQNITLKKYRGEDEFCKGHTVAYVGNEPAKSVALRHNPELVNGKNATNTEAGYKSYYMCKICGKYYEDAEEKTEIIDLDAWKAKGGRGYLPKLRKASDPIIIGGDDTNTSKQETNPETGAPVMNFGAIAVVLGAAFLLSKKK